MTVETFLILLTILSTATSLVTEAVKKFLTSSNIKYASNIVVLIVAILVGAGGMAIYYSFAGLPWTINNIICLLLMALFNWLGAMIGYDKVVQAITQIKTN